MRKKPSYEELKLQIKAFEKQVLGLKTVEKEYRDLFENAPIAYFSISREDGSILRFNSEAVRLLGYKKETLAQMKVFDLYADTAQGVSKAKALFERFQAGESIRNEELQMKSMDGRHIWVNLSVEPVKSNGGDVVESRSMLINISKRKLAEEALLQSELKYRTLVEQSLQGITVAQNDRIVFANEAFARIAGYTVEELYSLTPEKVWALIHPVDRKLVEERLRDRLEGKPVPSHYEFRGIRKDGSERFLEIHANLIMYDGKPAIQSTLLDITHIKQIEQALQKREKQLETKSKELEEVNTALRVLLKRKDEDKERLEKKILLNVKELVEPYLDKLKKSKLDGTQKSHLNILHTNLKDIISPFAHTLASQYLKLTPKEIQIADLIKHGKTTKEIADLLNLSPQTIESHRKNIRIKLGIRENRANLRTHLLSIT